MGIKLRVGDDGILRTADEKSVDAVENKVIAPSEEDLTKLLSDAEELTKDVVLATRNLQDEILRYGGITVKLAKAEEEKDKKDIEKDFKKKEKDLDDGIESLDSLVSQLDILVKKIDAAVKEKGKKLSPSELKGSDKIKDEAEGAIGKADKVLEEGDESMLKSKMKKKAPPKEEEKEEGKEEKKEMPKKSSALTDEEQTEVASIVEKSTTIADKAATKAKLALANDKTEARKILEDAGEKFASERSASMEKKAESPIIYEDKTLGRDYGRNKSPDQSQAKKEFSGNNEFINWQKNKMDRKWLVAMTNRMSNNKLAKFEKSLELVGESQLKDIVVDPLKTALVKNLVETGMTQKVASAIVDNSFIESKQESIEQLIKRAKELYDLDNVRFVEAKIKINKYVPGSEENVTAVQKTASKEEKTVNTVVSGVGSEQGQEIDYKRIFDQTRPTGAII